MRIARVGAVLAACLALQACECGGTTRTTVTTGAAPSPDPTPAPTPTPREETPPRPTIDEAQRAEVIRRVRAGRRAVRAERWDEALDEFEHALAISPRAPRLLCEAGFVAFRAGKLAIAARRIELGISFFPGIEAAPEALHAPIAMCLYNRGLVAEASGAVELARDSYARSLRMRRNATVERRLASLEVREARPREGATIDDVPLDVARSVVLATDEATLVRALERSLSGIDEFEPDEWNRAGVEVIQRAPLAWDAASASEVVLLTADDNGNPLGAVRLVLAFRVRDGYLVLPTDFGEYDNTDHGISSADSGTITSVHASATMLRIELDVCWDSSSQEVTTVDEHPDWACYRDDSYAAGCTSRTILCVPTDGDVRCAQITRAHRATEPASWSVWCTDENGEPQDQRAETSPLDTSHDFALDVAVDGDRVAITRASGTAPDDVAELIGARTVAELAERAPLGAYLRTDAELDAELARYRAEMSE
ncbi:tetratricopeptide repeat protein [Sandaracinus amylolyticus]|uniref:tetratricopeptide repeat protein n=1 Tax=Sandaracinus amylolyticus TaxID=927083 RepID=UPI001F3DDBE3|nr:hypothetical protein [Sandaracinus amylolyticus]UJR84020.1 Hypothetical protein I5071_60910 [Sandaracinus amylolyticus]